MKINLTSPQFHEVAATRDLARARSFPEPPRERGDRVMKSGLVRMTAAAIVGMALAAGATIAETPGKNMVQVAAASDKNIVETASAAGQFKTLTAAINAADLAETLKGSGPFTVFAPTDAAFAKLPAGTVETLLKPENRDRLAAILTYHVVPGKVTAAEVTKLDEAKTVNGRMIDVSTSGGTVMVNDAKVITADIPASNGIIHVIDTVILPPRG
jgi:uncharacterized surface protein with fasciclin (FAS1) repeats